MTDTTIEAAARAHCFADCIHTREDGEIVFERACACSTEADCFEINGSLREEMLGQAQAAIAAYLKVLESEGKRVISEHDLQELVTSRKLYEG